MPEEPTNLAARAKAEKYAKILSKTVINPDGRTLHKINIFMTRRGRAHRRDSAAASTLPPREIDLRAEAHRIRVRWCRAAGPSILPGKNEFQP